jgi:hypothetical protein
MKCDNITLSNTQSFLENKCEYIDTATVYSRSSGCKIIDPVSIQRRIDKVDDNTTITDKKKTCVFKNHSNTNIINKHASHESRLLQLKSRYICS